MAAVTGKQYGVGMRRSVIYALNTSGTPNATDTNPYSGVQVVGAKSFTLTIPEVRKITHTGDDRALAVDYLPPTEAASGELTVAQDNLAVLAVLSATNVLTIGESKAVGLATSQQGSEPQVGLLMYQQSLDSAGARNYRWFLLPKATLYARPGGMNENAGEHMYTIAPAVVTAHLWGMAFSATTEGFVEAQILSGESTYKPNIIAWKATTSQTTFAFPADQVAADTAKVVLWANGAVTTASTIATNLISITAPGNNVRVVAFYEY
jgi:hypothetical protein